MSRPPAAHPLQPISGPCSMEILDPREWRIAIPASLMRVEQQRCPFFLLDFLIVFSELLLVFISRFSELHIHTYASVPQLGIWFSSDTFLQTLISITLLNLTYSSHPVDCTIIQFKAEDRCLGKQADNYILYTLALVWGILWKYLYVFSKIK